MKTIIKVGFIIAAIFVVVGCVTVSDEFKVERDEYRQVVRAAMMENAKFFKYGSNNFRSPNEVAGVCFDYAIRFAYEWQKNHPEMISAVVIHGQKGFHKENGEYAPDCHEGVWNGTFIFLEKWTDDTVECWHTFNNKREDMIQQQMCHYRKPSGETYYVFHNKLHEHFKAIRPSGDQFSYYHPHFMKSTFSQRDVKGHAWVIIAGQRDSQFMIHADPTWIDSSNGDFRDYLFVPIPAEEINQLHDMLEIAKTRAASNQPVIRQTLTDRK